MGIISFNFIKTLLVLFGMNTNSPLKCITRRLAFKPYSSILFLENVENIELPEFVDKNAWILVSSRKINEETVEILKERGLKAIIYLEYKYASYHNLPTYVLNKWYYSIIKDAFNMDERRKQYFYRDLTLELIFRNALHVDILQSTFPWLYLEFCFSLFVIFTSLFFYFYKKIYFHRILFNEFKWKIYDIPNNCSENCSICLEVMDENKYCTMLSCKHLYHLECIKRWAYSNPICPICRINIV
ncbi:RING finger protein [Spraguea lophii 42_110]|uniref:RING-type E3 ubiquitin transferase n=1 Tax=Spraguea lophii (strain 42_110) TaxID=1358809 RepID=S7XLE5_SPRLO|nr:RING finger protein [Spraguea lophii 42_110]